MNIFGDIASTYAGPVYIYDIDLVDSCVADLKAALPQPSDLYYSIKANPHVDLLHALRRNGCLAEVSSQGELSTALSAGFSGKECLYTGPAKTDSEITFALQSGVSLFSIESTRQLEQLTAAASQGRERAGVLLRVNARRNVAAGGMHMTGSSSQFGIDLEHVPLAIDIAQDTGQIDLLGLHFFSITNARDESSLIREFLTNIAVARMICDSSGFVPSLIDIGGGFSAPYANTAVRSTYSSLASELTKELDAMFPDWRAGRPRVVFESGRYLVANCGTLLCTVTDVKVSMGKLYYLLDAGINVVGGLSGVGKLLPLQIEPLVFSELPSTSATLVGPLCTPADLLARDIDVPSLAPGDRVLIPNVGAYGITASLVGFISRPLPMEIVIRGGQVAAVSQLEVRRVKLDKSVNGNDVSWDDRFDSILRKFLPYLSQSDPVPENMHFADLGVDSMAIVQLLDSIESAFSIEFPYEALSRDTFGTPLSLWSVVRSLLRQDVI